MTLILSYISEDFLILVSDRRATWVAGKKRQFVDSDNKTIALPPGFIIGFTGLARLGGVRTERWAAQSLASGPKDSTTFTALGAATQAEIRRLRVPKPLAGHAYIALGYSPLELGGPVEPAAFTVSNALTGIYGQWAPSANWTTRRQTLEGHAFKMSAHGAVPSKSRFEQYIAWIEHYRKKHPAQPRGIILLLVRLLREVATANDEVSGDASISVLPRAAYPFETVDVAPYAEPIEQLTSYFIPGPGSRGELPRAYSPTLVTPLGIMSLEVQWGGNDYLDPPVGDGPPAP